MKLRPKVQKLSSYAHRPLASIVAVVDRVAIASRWTAAMSSKTGGALKAVAEVLADDVQRSTLKGRAAVLDWFKFAPGMSLFRTGAWEEPTVDGDVVSFGIAFDEKAAYYREVGAEADGDFLVPRAGKSDVRLSLRRNAERASST